MSTIWTQATVGMHVDRAKCWADTPRWLCPNGMTFSVSVTTSGSQQITAQAGLVLLKDCLLFNQGLNKLQLTPERLQSNNLSLLQAGTARTSLLQAQWVL